MGVIRTVAAPACGRACKISHRAQVSCARFFVPVFRCLGAARTARRPAGPSAHHL